MAPAYARLFAQQTSVYIRPFHATATSSAQPLPVSADLPISIVTRERKPGCRRVPAGRRVLGSTRNMPLPRFYHSVPLDLDRCRLTLGGTRHRQHWRGIPQKCGTSAEIGRCRMNSRADKSLHPVACRDVISCLRPFQSVTRPFSCNWPLAVTRLRRVSAAASPHSKRSVERTANDALTTRAAADFVSDDRRAPCISPVV